MTIPALLKTPPMFLEERMAAPNADLEKMIQEYKNSKPKIEPCFQECMDGINCDYPRCKKTR